MHPAINVICLPFAGGNKYSYRQFKDMVPPNLTFVGMEYPGRGARIKEPLLSNVEQLVNDLYQTAGVLADRQDYCLYGHSLGGLVGYLLARKLITTGHRPPAHLFITGTSGPSAASRGEKKRHLLSKPEFIQELKDLKGMPDEILENEDLLDYYEPILRADFMASETYIYDSSGPLNIPITVLTGTEEDMEEADIKLWQNESIEAVDFQKFPGSHFFIYDHVKPIVQIIKSKLLATTKVYQL